MRAYLRSVLDLLELATHSAEAGSDEDWSTVGALLDADVPVRLITDLWSLDFEARKDAVRVFEAFLRLGAALGAEEWVAEYVRARPQIPGLLLSGCKDADIAPFAGAMLRACAANAEVATMLLEAQAAEALLGLARDQNSDISFEAFATLRALLTAQGVAAAAHLEAAFVEFFDGYHELLQTADYVAQRQALRLLGDLLLSGTFRRVMLAYVGNAKFFQLHMNLLRDPSQAIRVEAFHVFKLFAGNPSKPLRVQAFLYRNRDRLSQVLEGLLAGRPGDEGLAADVRDVVGIIGAIRPPSTPQ